MRVSIGCDIVEISRIAHLFNTYGERFTSRILSSSELEDMPKNRNPVPFIAKRFAAKEAIVKALGTGFQFGIRFKDITIAHNDIGAPEVVLSGKAKVIYEQKNPKQIAISLSDERSFALAFAQIIL